MCICLWVLVLTMKVIKFTCSTKDVNSFEGRWFFCADQISSCSLHLLKLHWTLRQLILQHLMTEETLVVKIKFFHPLTGKFKTKVLAYFLIYYSTFSRHFLTQFLLFGECSTWCSSWERWTLTNWDHEQNVSIFWKSAFSLCVNVCNVCFTCTCRSVFCRFWGSVSPLGLAMLWFCSWVLSHEWRETTSSWYCWYLSNRPDKRLPNSVDCTYRQTISNCEGLINWAQFITISRMHSSIPHLSV